MTAVEKLVQEINKLTGLTIAMDEPCVKQAKEMEKDEKIEFAKLHVDAALRAVEAKIIVKGYAGLIMNIYPLENIE